MTPRTSADRGRLASGGGAVPLGLALIALGVVLLLDQLELVDARSVLADWWPLAVVGAGLWWLVTGARLAGAFVAALGLLLLGIELDVLDARLVNLVLPSAVVVAGVALVVAGRRLSGSEEAAALRSIGERRLRPPAPSPEGFTAVAIFGDAQARVADTRPGAEVVTVTGVVLFGDLRVDVPAGWRVRDRTTTFLGDVRLPSEPPPSSGAPTVELHGVVVFGDLVARYVDPAEVAP